MVIRPTAEVKEPADAVIQAASLLAPGRALDIACGAGRHAIWLYEHGWMVTAIDRNAEAIERIRSNHPAIDARIVDLEAGSFAMLPDSYDLVVCWLYHQRDLYPDIGAAARPGGIAALCALLQGRFAAVPGELRTYFPGWSILYETQTDRATELIIQRPHASASFSPTPVK